MKIVIGTRGSKLALAQTKWVMNELKKYTPEVEFELKVIQNQLLDEDSDKEVFNREIEKALLNQRIDLAVHRMKDMPSALPAGLIITGIPRREEARDALILKEGYEMLEDLPKGATLAARSKRRKYQLLAYRPDLNIVPIKGSIETDLQEVEEGGLDGIIRAAAYMHYMGLQEKITCYLPMHIMMPAPAQGALAIEIKEGDTRVKEMLKVIEDPISTIQIKITCYLPMHIMMPAPAQGALAIEIKEGDTRVKEMLKVIEDPISTIQIAAERAFMEEVETDYGVQGALAIEIKEGDTRVKEMLKVIEDPISTIQIAAERAFMEEVETDYGVGRMTIGAYCQVDGTKLRMCGLLGDEEGEKLVVKELSARVGIEKELGAELARSLKRTFK